MATTFQVIVAGRFIGLDRRGMVNEAAEWHRIGYLRSGDPQQSGRRPAVAGGEQRLYWLDLVQPAIYRFDPASGRNEQLRADTRELCRRPGVRGSAAAGSWSGRMASPRSTPSAAGRQVLLHPEADLPGNWFNDCKCDRQGRLWTGSADRGEKDPTRQPLRDRRQARRAQGRQRHHLLERPGLQPGRQDRLFRRQLRPPDLPLRYRPRRPARSARAAPSHRDPIEAGVPDGMTVDAEGFLWNAHWDGWRVTRYAPDGRIDRVITLPVPRPTAPAFGGEDLTTLYITSATGGLSDAQLAGGAALRQPVRLRTGRARLGRTELRGIGRRPCNPATSSSSAAA